MHRNRTNGQSNKIVTVKSESSDRKTIRDYSEKYPYLNNANMVQE